MFTRIYLQLTSQRAGTAVAGVVVPLAMDAALKAYGFRIALRGYAVIVFVLSVPALYVIKPRLPPVRVRRFDFSFLIAPDFLLLQTANIIQAVGYYMPLLYLPTYARQLGASAIQASSTLVALNLACMLGYIWVGRSVDRYHITVPMAVITVGATLSTLLVWGLTTHLALLFVFAVLYGLTAGGYPSLWSGMSRIVTRKTARAEPTLVVGFLAAGRGIGNIISGPISESLLDSNTWTGRFGYGSGYGPLIVLTGLTACVSGFAIFGRIRPGLL